MWSAFSLFISTWRAQLHQKKIQLTVLAKHMLPVLIKPLGTINASFSFTLNPTVAPVPRRELTPSLKSLINSSCGDGTDDIAAAA